MSTFDTPRVNGKENKEEKENMREDDKRWDHIRCFYIPIKKISLITNWFPRLWNGQISLRFWDI